MSYQALAFNFDHNIEKDEIEQIKQFNINLRKKRSVLRKGSDNSDESSDEAKEKKSKLKKHKRQVSSSESDSHNSCHEHAAINENINDVQQKHEQELEQLRINSEKQTAELNFKLIQAEMKHKMFQK